MPAEMKELVEEYLVPLAFGEILADTNNVVTEVGVSVETFVGKV